MQDQQVMRQLLQQARQRFLSGDFNAAKGKLEQINEDDRSVLLNKLLIEFQMGSPQNCQVVLKLLLNMLTQTNIDLYKKNRPNQINFISHEMLYLNIVAMAEYLGKNTLAQMVGSEALFFYKCLQTSTALILIYQNLRRTLTQNRLSTSLDILSKFQKIIQHTRNLSTQQQRLKIMVNVLFTSALIKLKMIEQSKAFFMLKFGQSDSQKFILEQKASRTRRKNKITYKDVNNFLKAQIDFADKNFQKSINGMIEYLASESNREKIYAQNNIAINLCFSGKAIAAQKIFIANCETLSKVLSTNKKDGTELPELFQKTKENIITSYLYSRQTLNSVTHFNVESDQKCYNQIKTLQDLFSFKQQYRKGQSCVNLYHSLLQKSSRKLPWQQIHDNYDNVYYFPNQPYVPFKGRSKNVYSGNKKPVYRRYVLNQFNDDPSQQQVDKDQNRRKFQKQANTLKLNQILLKAEQSFRKSLILLEKQQSLVIRFEAPEINSKNIINQRLYNQYTRFKSSILCLLAYTALCLCNWHQVIRYCEQFTSKKCGQISPQNNYSVLTYQIEAYCYLNRIDAADKLIHILLSNGISKTSTFDCRDGSNLSSCNMQMGMTQQINFIYNMAVLHSRSNRIPEAHQSIQNLFAKMNGLQNYPRSQLPLSTLQLLIHYHLRTQNFSAALQLIKRRRIIPHGSKPILNITK